MSKVLCATDNSDPAKKAEAFAARYAKAMETELSYVYVSSISQFAYEDIEATRSSSVEVLNESELKEITVLSGAKDTAQEIGFQEPECVLLRSHRIASAIVKYARSKGFDLIVMGTVGDTTLTSELLGSVANQVIHQAPCAVTVVR